MASKTETKSVAAWVGLGAVVWGLLLLVAWAIHPIDGVAAFAPVENPSAAEQVSIDRFLARGDEAQANLVVRFRCGSSPLDVVTTKTSSPPGPALDAGFAYVDPPCSSAYRAARAAFWVNTVMIAVIVAASAVLYFRRRGDPGGTPTSGAAPAVVNEFAHSDE